jgi:hypothetical protein
MPIIIKSHPAGRCSRAQVEKFEELIGAKLPSDYRDWLLEFNGGRPSPKRMEFVEHGTSTGSDVHWIYGIGSPDWADVNDSYVTFKRRIPHACLPIARDSGGNQYLLDLIAGGIWFWNHEEGTESPEDRSNMSFCANSFTDFLGRLQEGV